MQMCTDYGATFDHQESSEMIKCVPLDYGATFDHQESSEMIKCVPLDYGATFDHQTTDDQMCTDYGATLTIRKVVRWSNVYLYGADYGDDRNLWPSGK